MELLAVVDEPYPGFSRLAVVHHRDVEGEIVVVKVGQALALEAVVIARGSSVLAVDVVVDV